MDFLRKSLAVTICLSAVLFAQSNMKMRQIAIIELPGKPGYDAATFANGMLLMSHSSADTVDIFDPVKRRLVAQVQGISEPRGIAVDLQSGLAYIAAQGANSITVLDTKDWSVRGVIGLKHAPENLLLIPGTGSLLVSNPGNRSVSVVSTESIAKKEAELATIDVRGKPQQLAWDPSRRVAYLALEDRAEIVALNPTNVSDAIVKRFPVNASQPTGLIFDAAANRLFVAVRYAVLQLDAETGNEVARAPAAAGTDTLWLDQSSKTLYAAAGDGSVNIYRINGNIAADNEFRAEVRGHAIAFEPNSKMMYLSGGREGKSKVLILKQANIAPVAEAQTAENR
jgi:DNA-binding beta-propeller fold protein YncE